MKKALILSFCLIWAYIQLGYAQHSIDSLKKVILNSNDKEILFQTFGVLCQMHKFINKDSAIYFGKKSISIGSDSNLGFLSTINMNVGNAFLDKLNFDSAIIYLNQSLKIALQVNNWKKLESSYESFSYFYNNTFDYSKALEFINKAILIGQVNNEQNDRICEFLIFKAGIYSNSGDNKKSAQLLDSIKPEVEKSKDFITLSSFYEAYAKKCYYQHEYYESIKYSQKAKQIGIQLKDDMFICSTLGIIYYSYIYLFEKNKIENHKIKALEVIQEAIQLAEKIGDFDRITNCYNAKAYLSEINGDYSNAIRYAKKSLIFAKQSNSLGEQLNAYSTLCNSFEFLKKYDSLYTYYTLYRDINDSIKGNNVKFTMEKIELKANFEYKEFLQKTKEEKLIQENDTKLLMRNFSLVIITLIFGAGFLIFNFKKQKQLHAKYEEFSKQLLIVQEQEKTKIAMELHDNIGQNLLLIKNQLNLINEYTEKTKQSILLVDRSLEDIRGLSKQLHPHLVETTGLKKAVNHMLEQSQISTGIYFTSEIIENIDALFSKENVIHIYRIIQESVNNIVKHSKAKSAKVTIDQEGKNINITIQDNGIGFNKNILQSNSIYSFGFTSLKERTSIIKGELNIETSPGKGVKINIKIPITND